MPHPRRQKEVSITPILRVAPVLGKVTLQGPIGASAAYFDTKVKVERVTA